MLSSERLFWLLLSVICFFSIGSTASFFDGEPYTGSKEQLDKVRSVASQRIAARTSQSAPAATQSTFTVSVNKHANTSQTDIARARAIVAAALADSAAANRARMNIPLRNSYRSRHSTSAKPRRDVAPLPVISTSVAAAAAMVAEIDAAAYAKNGSLYGDYSQFDTLRTRRTGESPRVKKRQTTSFWMEGMEHLGTQLGNSSYKVLLCKA